LVLNLDYHGEVVTHPVSTPGPSALTMDEVVEFLSLKADRFFVKHLFIPAPIVVARYGGRPPVPGNRLAFHAYTTFDIPLNRVHDEDRTGTPGP
jgi:hypothetical protein